MSKEKGKKNDLLENEKEQSVENTTVKEKQEATKANEVCVEVEKNDSLDTIQKVAEVARVATPVLTNKHFEDENRFYSTPTFSKRVYENLPAIIKRACVFPSQRENDMFLNALLSVMSGCLYNLTGIYDDKDVYPNLYTFNIAPAASGKGVQKFASEFARVYSDYLKKHPIDNKSIRSLLIPANASIAALMELLEENGGIGAINETEADSLANAMGQDWGDISAILRANFHHEPVSSIRKMDKKFIDLNNTRFSIALAGTFDQYKRIFKSSENGLYSRFIYYGFNQRPVFRNVKPTKGKPTFNKIINQIAIEFCPIAHKINSVGHEFNLTDVQWDKLESKYLNLTEESNTSLGESINSSITRLGLIEYKLAMLLSAIRFVESGSNDSYIECLDVDFDTAQEITSVYANHLKCFIEILPIERTKIGNHKRYYFFDNLKELNTFEYSKAVEIGITLGIGVRSISTYLKQLVAEDYIKQTSSHGLYMVNHEFLTKQAS